MLSADAPTADVVARVGSPTAGSSRSSTTSAAREADLEPDDREMECADFINSVKIFAPGGERATRVRARAARGWRGGRTDARAPRVVGVCLDARRARLPRHETILQMLGKLMADFASASTAS